MHDITLKIYGMDCAEEVTALKQVLKLHVKDVEKIHFDLLNGKLTIQQEFIISAEPIVIKAIAKLGMKAEPWQLYLLKMDHKKNFFSRYFRLLSTLTGLIFLLVGSAFEWWAFGLPQSLSNAHHVHQFPTTSEIFFLLSILASGWFVLPKAYHALRRFRPDMNLLMLIAVVGAVCIDQWSEAAMVTFLFSLALLLETWSIGRARNAIQALLSVTPTTARLYCSHHGEDVKPVAEVRVGATMIIRSGEKIPLDAVVIRGESHIDQSPITGESLPVHKKVGDIVYAGTINQEGVIECQVTKAYEDTAFAQIIKRIEEAQSYRAKSEQWVEQFAKYYTPAMIIVALLVAFVPTIFFGQSWQAWIYEALVVLVIACPCALVISTPVSIVAGLSAAAKMGVLIKGGTYLELPASLKTVAFDKTGTITKGEPIVQVIQSVGGLSDEGLMRLIGSLEALSDHPLAKAIRSFVIKHQIVLAKPESTKEIQGRGITGLVDGQAYWIGSHRYFHERVKAKEEVEKIHDDILALEDAGHSLLIVGRESEVLGFVSVADAVRDESAAVVRALHAMGIKTALLTGDNEGTAKAIGTVCHFDSIHAQLLPEDKVSVIRLLAKEGKVAMVGDGINDAPALATADLGIAMASMGADAAVETADIALMSDDLSKLPWLIQHSRRVMRVIKQNIAFALLIKLVFLSLAILKLATLWMAILADTGASLLVVANGLRLLKQKSTQLDMH